MQNLEFSEEYYKMKYFKYRAKYEQLKEIAAAQSNGQTGGMSYFNFTGSSNSSKKKTQPVQPVQPVQPTTTLNPNAPPYVPGQPYPPVPPTNQEVQQPPSNNYSISSALKAVGLDKESRQASAQKRQEQKEATSAEIQQLLTDIYDFSSANLTEEKKKIRLRAKLESSSSPADLIKIINRAPMSKSKQYTLEEASKLINKHQETQANLIDQVNRLCKTTLGGLNTECRMPDEDDIEENNKQTQEQIQNGGYTLTPESLDDINTEF